MKKTNKESGNYSLGFNDITVALLKILLQHECITSTQQKKTFQVYSNEIV